MRGRQSMHALSGREIVSPLLVWAARVCPSVPFKTNAPRVAMVLANQRIVNPRVLVTLRDQTVNLLLLQVCHSNDAPFRVYDAVELRVILWIPPLLCESTHLDGRAIPRVPKD